MLKTEKTLNKSLRILLNNEPQHYPVMYREAVQLLLLDDKQVLVDCTFGLGSHAAKFANEMQPGSLIVGIDKDKQALEVAARRIGNKFNCHLCKEDFRNLDIVLDDLGVKQVDAFFFDLGLSNLQVSAAERGFSFRQEGPLDMRMDQDSFLSAFDLINYLSKSELKDIFRKFGEERFSGRIARKIVEHRHGSPITSTLELSNIIFQAVPAKFRRSRIHPATRVFQALRIAVNRELEALDEGLSKAIKYLKPQGRIAVISFHSLEDRIVKHKFKEFAASGQLQIITKKPVTPTKEEIAENKPSRSAKLRVVEKTDYEK